MAIRYIWSFGGFGGQQSCDQLDEWCLGTGAKSTLFLSVVWWINLCGGSWADENDWCRHIFRESRGCVRNKREVQDEKHATMRKRLTGPRILGARIETGPAKSCPYNLSRCNAVAALCFLCCGESSSLPLRSRQLTTVNASAVLRAEEGATHFFSQSERRAKIGAKHTLELPESSHGLGSPIAAREADRVGLNQVRSKSTHGINTR